MQFFFSKCLHHLPCPPVPTAGDAHFYDVSVRQDIDRIRRVLGVCPQHDVLWGDLTALEHMKLFGNLKGLPPHVLDTEITSLLAEVQLDKVVQQL